jgi:hypothetical protein
MNCPHCNYEGSTGTRPGRFWTRKAAMERSSMVSAPVTDTGDQTADLLGCPKCKKTFIGNEVTH